MKCNLTLSCFYSGDQCCNLWGWYKV